MSELGPQNLLIVCLDSLGAAYKAVQLAPNSVDVLEVFPLGLQGHVIFSSSQSLENLAASVQKELAENIITLHHLANCPAKVLRAYLSVENANLNKHILIAESPYIGDLFALGASAVGVGLQIMDLRMLRGASSASYLFLTGAIESLQKVSSATKAKTTLIADANAHIVSLFNIQP